MLILSIKGKVFLLPKHCSIHHFKTTTGLQQDKIKYTVITHLHDPVSHGTTLCVTHDKILYTAGYLQRISFNVNDIL